MKFTRADQAPVSALRVTRRLVLLSALGVLLPARALAHAFGARYDLPIPLWLWVLGAGAVVGVSFILVGFHFRHRQPADTPWHFDILTVPGLRGLSHPTVIRVIQLLAVMFFLLIIVAGLLGNQTTTKNIAPVLVWVIWWVGFAYVIALLGNLWRLVNPWRILFQLSERRLFATRRPVRPYPAWLGAWPAVVFFFCFAWLEIVSGLAEVPAQLAGLIIAYSIFTWAGMATYGRETWLANGEAFSVCFGLLSRFAILSGGHDRRSRPALYLRPPAVGLLVDRPVGPSTIAFTVLLLATVSFDGIAETPLWAGILQWFSESHAVRPLLIALLNAGADLSVVIRTLGLVATPMVFLAVYLSFSWLTAVAGGGTVPTRDVAGAFVLTLIPIAIAYHLAHYISYLLLAGQLVIPLASDPLGLGWNLFGTAAYAIDISVVSAKMVWYVATIAIVMGHVAAVYLGHVMALQLFSDGRTALRSQVPMLILMVAYSMLSLWILSQPIVEIGS